MVFPQDGIQTEAIGILKDHVLSEASLALTQEPLTVTSYRAPRSAGSVHDFYSEGDYWWPDPTSPDGPYVQRDGQTNPDNFVDHRRAMIRLSRIVGVLASAYKITGDEKYARRVLVHADAWFVNPETKMNPSLLYAQAIKGRATGRGIGIIDTIHLMEVAQGLSVVEGAKGIDLLTIRRTKYWFSEYIRWLTTHQYGKDEMNAQNNHGTCWVMQVASFARFTGNEETLQLCRDRYKNVLLPKQMSADGSFSRELGRTKPYGYSIFNLDAMATICHILSDAKNDLWNFQTQDGRSIRKGIEFLYPFIKDKDTWPYAKDVMYWDNWPVAQPFLLFGAIAYSNGEWMETWRNLDHKPEVEEVIRNLPIRNPVIWLN
jgi:hypothetical protein